MTDDMTEEGELMMTAPEWDNDDLEDIYPAEDAHLEAAYEDRFDYGYDEGFNDPPYG